MGKTRFSIIVPVYNNRIFLRDCINSVLEQAFQDFELLLIDDGSTDGSQDIVDEYASLYKEKILVHHKENGGVSSSRNFGINIACGDYIIFLDSDDILAENILSQIDQDLRISDVDIAVSNEYIEINESENNIILFQPEAFENINLGNDAIREMCQNLSSVCVGVYRLDFIKQNNIYFNTSITFGEDTDWFFRALLLSDKIVIIKGVLLKYRNNPKSITQNVKFEQIRTLQVMCKLNIDNLIVYPSSKINVKKALNFFAVKFVRFSSKMTRVSDTLQKKILHDYVSENKYLLQYAYQKPDCYVKYIIKVFGISGGFMLLNILINMRNKVQQSFRS